MVVNLIDQAVALEGGTEYGSGNERIAFDRNDHTIGELGDKGSGTHEETTEGGAIQPVPFPGGSRPCTLADCALQAVSQIIVDS